MSSFISTRANFSEIDARPKRMGVEGTRVSVRSLNATVVQGNAKMASNINREFRIRVGEAKNRQEVKNVVASPGALRFEAALGATRRAKARLMNLSAFVETVTSLAQARKRTDLLDRFEKNLDCEPLAIVGGFVK